MPPELLPVPYVLDVEAEPPAAAPAFVSADPALDLSRRWSSRFSYRERQSTWSPDRSAHVSAHGALWLKSSGSGNGTARLGPLEVSLQTREATDPVETRELVNAASTMAFTDADLVSPSAATWFTMMGPVPLAPRRVGVVSVTVPVEMRVGYIDNEDILVRGERTIWLRRAGRIGGRRCARVEYEDAAVSDRSEARAAASMRGARSCVHRPGSRPALRAAIREPHVARVRRGERPVR